MFELQIFSAFAGLLGLLGKVLVHNIRLPPDPPRFNVGSAEAKPDRKRGPGKKTGRRKLNTSNIEPRGAWGGGLGTELMKGTLATHIASWLQGLTGGRLGARCSLIDSLDST